MKKATASFPDGFYADLPRAYLKNLAEGGAACRRPQSRHRLDQTQPAPRVMHPKLARSGFRMTPSS
jgi:hypothetical protein